MLKRTAATLIWFYAAWCGYEMLAYVTGLPRIIGPAAATAVAAFVGLDPFDRIWMRTPTPSHHSDGRREALTELRRHRPA